MISIVSVVSIVGWFHWKWKMPTNSYTNNQPKLLCFKNCFPKRCIILKNRSLAILIPKKLHLKFVRMKLLNRKNEARNLIKNISDESFFSSTEVFFESPLGLMRRLPRGIWLWKWRSSVLYVHFFFVLQSKRNSLCVENGTILSHKYSFQPIIMAPEFTEGCILGQTRVTNSRVNLYSFSFA